MNGLLLVNKPKGMTSHDVVNQIRKLTKIKKVGHTGTLDPNASGLLIICIGEATKLIPYLNDSTKVYEAEIAFGKQTTTDDVEGEVIAQKEINTLTLNQLEEVIPQFLGEIDQIPPIYSAKKVNGKKLYEYARNNKSIDIKPSKVTIDEITILDTSNFPESIKVLVKCSKGTYIRALARDIGKALDNYAYLKELNRIQTNDFDLNNSIPLNELNSENINNYVKPLEFMKDSLESVNVYPGSGKYLNNGNKLYQLDLVENIDNLDFNQNILLILNGKIKGIGTKVNKNNEIFIQPKKVLNIDSRG